MKQDVAFLNNHFDLPMFRSEIKHTIVENFKFYKNKQKINQLLNKTLNNYSLFLLFLKFINFCVFG